MELIIADPTYNHTDKDYKQFIIDLKKELSLISKEFKIKRTDIGHGADWPAVLIIIGGLFFLGKSVNENLDAWLSIGKKFAALLKSIKEKFGAFRINEEGASILAIQHISEEEQGKIVSIEKIAEKIIPISPFKQKSQDHLDYRPDALYYQIYKVNKEIFYIFGIKSKGTIEIKHRIDTSDWMNF